MHLHTHVHPHVLDIVKALNAHDEEGYLVGGAVRDLLLGTEPKDYDLATSATPEKVKMIFGSRAKIIGKRFRLVHVQFGREIYEVSTFRRKPDEDERKGREDDSGLIIWRDNVYGNLEEDAFRRDFTVNALYYDPIKQELIDHTGGKDDMDKGIVRAIGNASERLQEDPVRMIRALKLMAQYDFKLEASLDKALRELAESITLSSRARLFDEIIKIARKPYSVETFNLLYEYDLLKFLLPSLHKSWNHNEGELCRQLLTVRDRKISTGPYSDSRILAFGTICFAYVQRKMQKHLGEDGEFWKYGNGLERYFKQEMFNFFRELSIPKFLRLRLTNMMLALPRFMLRKKRQLLLQNREYRYARELFAILVEVFEIDPKILSLWPVKSAINHPKPKRQGRRRRRPNKRRDIPHN